MKSIDWNKNKNSKENASNGMSDKYNICHICSYYDTPLFSDLVEHQLEFTNPRVFYYQHYEHLFENGEKEYVDKCACYKKWERIDFYRKQNKAITRYKKIYSKDLFQLNYAHSMFTNGYVAYQIKREWGIPYIVAIQNTDLNVFFKYAFWLRSIGIKILLSAERVVVSSNSYENILLDQYISSRYKQSIKKKIEVIPYGIQEFYVNNQYYTQKNLKNKLKIISVGRINKNKNQLLICKAILKALEKGIIKEVLLEIIGENTSPNILNKIKKYPFVKYYDYMNKEDLLKHYREADFFMLLSKKETFGLVYAEALSQGLPIIYTKGQGFDLQFPEGQVGFHAELSEDNIIQKLKLILDSYNTIQSRCNISARKFFWDKINLKYQKVYKDILLR